MIKGKKIIITGGAGFIGSHIVEELLQLGADITVVDIALYPYSYFQTLLKKQAVTIAFVDITDKERIIAFIKKNKPEYIMHLAAETIVTTAYNHPWRTFQTNIMGTVNILEAARQVDSIQGVIVASSDKAYGKTKEAYTENSPLQGDHPYDVSKSATDLIASTYYKSFGLPVTITRFGNVYGEGDIHMDRIIPGICEAIIKNSPLEIRSNGKYVRDYLYVKDVVRGYLTLLKNISVAKGEAYNFSSKTTLSVIGLIKEAERILKEKIPYTILNTAKNEIPYQHLDDIKIRKLGWKADTSLQESLPKILRWYKENYC